VITALSLYERSFLPLLFVGLELVWQMAHADLWPPSTCWAGRKCARSPAELSHIVHESRSPLSLLEHELSPGAPHVPPRALPRYLSSMRS
jgi:hypothetical protein